MRVASEAGPLIALGRLGILGLLFRLYGQVAIARAVFSEVVNRGKEVGAPDARQTELAIARQHILVIDLKDEDLLETVRIPALARAD